MSHPDDPQLDAFAVDVRALLERSVANLYSHLVTRPTGRAVRLAIESQLAELRTPALSLVDLSSVAILDYSCADEVIAKLLLRRGGRGGEAFFVLRGVQAHHRDPIEAVLERHDLAVVAETASDHFELMGSGSEGERKLWMRLEQSGWVRASEVGRLLEETGGRKNLEVLIERHLLFRHPLQGDLHALSTLIQRPA